MCKGRACRHRRTGMGEGGREGGKEGCKVNAVWETQSPAQPCLRGQGRQGVAGRGGGGSGETESAVGVRPVWGVCKSCPKGSHSWRRQKERPGAGCSEVPTCSSTYATHPSPRRAGCCPAQVERGGRGRWGGNALHPTERNV